MRCYTVVCSCGDKLSFMQLCDAEAHIDNETFTLKDHKIDMSKHEMKIEITAVPV
jgi:hypothetical protein